MRDFLGLIRLEMRLQRLVMMVFMAAATLIWLAFIILNQRDEPQSIRELVLEPASMAFEMMLLMVPPFFAMAAALTHAGQGAVAYEWLPFSPRKRMAASLISGMISWLFLLACCRAITTLLALLPAGDERLQAVTVYERFSNQLGPGYSLLLAAGYLLVTSCIYLLITTLTLRRWWVLVMATYGVPVVILLMDFAKISVVVPGKWPPGWLIAASILLAALPPLLLCLVWIPPLLASRPRASPLIQGTAALAVGFIILLCYINLQVRHAERILDESLIDRGKESIYLTNLRGDIIHVTPDGNHEQLMKGKDIPLLKLLQTPIRKLRDFYRYSHIVHDHSGRYWAQRRGVGNGLTIDVIQKGRPLRTLTLPVVSDNHDFASNWPYKSGIVSILKSPYAKAVIPAIRLSSPEDPLVWTPLPEEDLLEILGNPRAVVTFVNHEKLLSWTENGAPATCPLQDHELWQGDAIMGHMIGDELAFNTNRTECPLMFCSAKGRISFSMLANKNINRSFYDQHLLVATNQRELFVFHDLRHPPIVITPKPEKGGTGTSPWIDEVVHLENGTITILVDGGILGEVNEATGVFHELARIPSGWRGNSLGIGARQNVRTGFFQSVDSHWYFISWKGEIRDLGYPRPLE